MKKQVIDWDKVEREYCKFYGISLKVYGREQYKKLIFLVEKQLKGKKP